MRSEQPISVDHAAESQAPRAPIKSGIPIGTVGRMWARNRWLVADQVLVSGLNFLTSAALARMLGVHDFGVFSVLFVVLQYLNSIQLSVIVSPMMTIAPQLQESSRVIFLRGVAGFQFLFSLSCSLVVLLLPLVHKANLIHVQLGMNVAVGFVVTIFCCQAQDWLRRLWYVREHGRILFWNDAISYGGQLLCLLILWRTQIASVTSAFFAVGLTSFVAFVVGSRREDIWGSFSQIRSAAAQTWALGKELLIANQFQWLGSQGILLIVAVMAGVDAASGIRAVITLLGPVNILYQLLDNVIPVRAARTFALSGEQGLQAYLRRAGVVIILAVAVPIVCVTVAARPVLMLAFGDSFGQFSHLVALQAGYALLALVYRGLQYYHRTVGSVGILARSALIVSIISVSSCVFLSRQYGATGGMIALLTGQILNVLIPLRQTLTKKQAAIHS